MAGSTKFTLHIRGRDVDDGHVRVEDFINQLASFRRALVATDHISSESSSTYFRIIDLQHNSPALVEVEAVPVDPSDDNPGRVVDRFFRSLEDIGNGIAPDGFDYSTFQAFEGVTALLSQKRITELTVSRNGDQAKLLAPLAPQIEKILGSDEYEVGSATGMLDQINIHANNNVFVIYPTTRKRRLRCIFPNELRPQAVKAVGQYVRVYGQMKYKSHLEDRYPYGMLVKELEEYPPESELPTLGSLRGIASDTPLPMPSEEFIRRVRDEW